MELPIPARPAEPVPQVAQVWEAKNRSACCTAPPTAAAAGSTPTHPIASAEPDVIKGDCDTAGGDQREEGVREHGAGDERLRSRCAREFDFEAVDLSGVKKIVGMKVGEETKKNALSKLLSKDTRLLKLLEGCGQEVSAAGGGAGSQMGLWDSNASVLRSAPNWVELSRAIAAVEQARESAASCQGAAVLAKKPLTLGSSYPVAALVHDVTGKSRQEADTLRIAAIVVPTEQALPQANARQRDERQRVRQIEKIESKLREGELGPGDKEVQPANGKWLAGGVEGEGVGTKQAPKDIPGFGASHVGIKTLGSAGRGQGTTSTAGASRRGAGGKTGMSQTPRTIAGLEAKAATDDALAANRSIAQNRLGHPATYLCACNHPHPLCK